MRKEGTRIEQIVAETFTCGPNDCVVAFLCALDVCVVQQFVHFSIKPGEKKASVHPSVEKMLNGDETRVSRRILLTLARLGFMVC